MNTKAMSGFLTEESQFAENRAYICILLASSIVAFYDFFLSMQLELSEIWTGKVTAMKALYIFNRYPFLIYSIIRLYTALVLGKGRLFVCGTFVRLLSSLDCFPPICITAIFLLRTFVLYCRDWRIVVVLGLPGLGVVVAVILNAIRVPCLPLAVAYTVNSVGFESEVHISSSLDIICTVFASLFDSLVLVLTVARSYKRAKQARKLGFKRSLWNLFLQDGLLYYLVIFSPQIASIVAFVLSIEADDALSIYFYPICQTLSSIMTGHLVLNLSHAALRDPDMDSSGISDASSLHINLSTLQNVELPAMLQVNATQ